MKAILAMSLMMVIAAGNFSAFGSDRPNQLIKKIVVEGWSAHSNIIYFSGESVDGLWKHDYKLDASVFGGINDARWKLILALLLSSKQNGDIMTINVDDGTTHILKCCTYNTKLTHQTVKCSLTTINNCNRSGALKV